MKQRTDQSDELYGRQLEECSTLTAVQTDFNEDDRIPAFVGIMFETYPRVDLELQTLELDVRFPEGRDVDMTVEVYEMEGSFELLQAYDERRWTKIVETELVMLSRSKAIIPASHFPSFSMAAKKRKSFYVSLTGPYLDYTAVALEKTGELQKRTPDLDVFVGVGFNKAHFPGDFDKNLDPQFAGVMHFKKTDECKPGGLPTETTVEYHYLIDKERSEDLMLAVNDAVEEAVNNLLGTSSTLQTYQEKYGLALSDIVKTGKKDYSGNCPEDWDFCPGYYLRTLVKFSHGDKLDSGHLRYQMYKDVDASITKITQQKLAERRVKYIGSSSVSAKISLELTGSTLEDGLDNVQLDYLSETTVEFLNEWTAKNFEFFSFDVQKQRQQTRRLGEVGNYEETGTIIIEGSLLGGHDSVYDANTFRSAVEGAFSDHADLYMQKLRLNGFRPSAITEGDGIEYFNSIASIGGDVKLDAVPQAPVIADDGNGEGNALNPMNDLSPEDNSMVMTVVFALIGALVLLVVLFFLRQWYLRARHRRDRKKMQKLRQQKDWLNRKAEQLLKSPEQASASKYASTEDSSEPADRRESRELPISQFSPLRQKEWDSEEEAGFSLATPQDSPVKRERSRSVDDGIPSQNVRALVSSAQQGEHNRRPPPMRSYSTSAGGRGGPRMPTNREFGKSKSFDDADYPDSSLTSPRGPPPRGRGYPPASPYGGGRGYMTPSPSGRGYNMSPSPGGGRGYSPGRGRGYPSPGGGRGYSPGRGRGYPSPGGGRGYSPGRGRGYPSPVTPGGGRGYSPAGRGRGYGAPPGHPPPPRFARAKSFDGGLGPPPGCIPHGGRGPPRRSCSAGGPPRRRRSPPSTPEQDIKETACPSSDELYEGEE